MDMTFASNWQGERTPVSDGLLSSHAPSMSPPAVDSDEFKQAMRTLAGGVAIVTSGHGRNRRGMTVSAVTSVSAEPPCLLIGVNTSAEAHGTILETGAFTVNLLGIEQKELAMRFAGQGGLRGLERFATGSWIDDGPLGLPLLEDALCAMECEIMQSHLVGTHRLIVGRIVHSHTRSGRPLINYQGMLQTLEAA
ncbi:flavin reductase family protein [Mesorhizobium sp. CAU 1741]|uniref:flavin reductase family protein n=1 Tax=Mesorhizobium sp. CAU 1741 TaxID=3140366 RepID=UPI00325C0843